MTSTVIPPAPTPAPSGALETLPEDDAPQRTVTTSRWRRVWRGPETDPAWARPALFALLTTTAILYLWGLGASGWANTYYSAAVQAGTQSWKAFFFGSTDASNFITVDKAPLALWPMVVSARIFGVNSWSILVPQAVEGVLTVGILYAAVKRWFGPGAALVAGAVCATTPVAVLMFRFNNPDAALTLLMVAGAYAMTAALERDSTRWIVLAGVAIGLAFLAKELQAFLVLPGFGLAYLIAGPPKLGRRVWHVILLGLTTIVAGGWWVAIVQLWPASSRPYIGGSQDNSFFNVLFGYNGFGRLTGNETGSVGGAPQGGTGQWGPVGLTRLFNGQFGGQASWLIPSVLVLLAAGLVWTVRRPRTDRSRAALVLWGGWLVITGLAISLGQGIIHPYYTVALAPAIGAVIGIGGALMWRHRDHWAARVSLAVAVAASAIWAAVLLDRTPSWMPRLHDLVLVGGIAVAIVLCFRSARTGLVVLGAAIVVGLAAPTAYTLNTVRTSHNGAIPSAGPAGQGQAFGPGGGPGGFLGGGAGGTGGNLPSFPGGGTGNLPNFPGGGTGNPPNFPGGAGVARGQGGLGGLLGGTTVGTQLTKLLQRGSDGYRWTAAATGANNAASYQLASGEAIMAIGGFNGSDPAPSLAEFKQYVRDGKIHYFISGGSIGGARGFPGGPGGNTGGANGTVPGGGTLPNFPGGAGGRGGFGPGGGTSSAISTWVTSHFQSRTVNGVTIYDLTKPATSSTTGTV